MNGWRIWVAAATVAASALVAVACASPGAGGVTQPEWVTFENQWFSLQLPDTFKGGDPYDPEVLELLEEMGTGNPDPGISDIVLETVEEWRGQVSEGTAPAGMVLLMWGEPDSTGQMPIVIAVAPVDKDGLSLREYAAMLDERFSGMLLEDITDERAFFVTSERSLWDPYVEDEPVTRFRQYLICLNAGSKIGEVTYTFDSEANTELDTIFRTSAETIRVKGSEQ